MDTRVLETLIRRYEQLTLDINLKVRLLIQKEFGEELTGDQHIIARYIMEHDKCTNTELAKVFYVKKSAITAMTTRLFNKGIIKRRRDNSDRRIVYLSLTQEGRDYLMTCDQKAIAIVRTFVDRFEVTEIERFFQTYEKLNDILTEKMNQLEE